MDVLSPSPLSRTASHSNLAAGPGRSKSSLRPEQHFDSRLSTRSQRIMPFLPLELRALVEDRIANGMPVYDFGLGEPSGSISRDTRSALLTAFDDEDTGYAHPAGIISLRRQALSWLQLEDEYSEEHVVISGGANHALLMLLHSICDPGDNILLPAAPPPSYLAIAHMAGVNPHFIPHTGGEDAELGKVTKEDLLHALEQHSDARAFLLSSPANPTGQIYSSDELNALVQLCVDHGVYFVLDRRYWKLLFSESIFPTPTIDAQTHPWVIQIDSLSNTFPHTGGLRVGWTIGPADVAESMASLQSHTNGGTARPSQRAALEALSRGFDKSYLRALTFRRDLFISIAREIPGLVPNAPQAGLFALCDVRALLGRKTLQQKEILSSAQLAEYLLESHGVVVTPGESFCIDGFLRFCFACSEQEIREGLRQVSRALNELLTQS